MVVKRDTSKDASGSYRSVGRGEAIFGDIVVGIMVTAIGALFTAVAIGMFAMGLSSVVEYVGTETGLLQAWAALVHITTVAPMTSDAFAGLIVNNLLFGAMVGTVLGLLQFVRRWRKGRHREVIEAVISPSGAAAVSYGLTTLALHILISCLAAWAAGALLGIFLPSPAALFAGQDAGLFVERLMEAGGGGDGGAGGEGIGLLIAFVVLLLIAAVIVCNLFAALGWVLFRIAPWGEIGKVAGEGAVSGGASGIGALAAAVLLQSAVTRFAVKGDGDGGSVRDLRDGGRSFFHAFATAAITGAMHSLVYAVAVFTLSAMFGITVMGGEPPP